MPKTRKKKCRFCGIWFYPVPQSKDRQIQCGTPACAKKRRKYSQTVWHREKAPIYFYGRYQSDTKPFFTAHPGYQQEYRANNPEKVARNREQQKKRDQKRGKRNLDKQDSAFLQHELYQRDTYKLSDLDKQDAAFPYPQLFLGFMSQLRNLDKQDSIDIRLHSIYNRGRFLFKRYVDL